MSNQSFSFFSKKFVIIIATVLFSDICLRFSEGALAGYSTNVAGTKQDIAVEEVTQLKSALGRRCVIDHDVHFVALRAELNSRLGRVCHWLVSIHLILKFAKEKLPQAPKTFTFQQLNYMFRKHENVDQKKKRTKIQHQKTSVIMFSAVFI